MPILKASEPIPERPVVIAIYGEPGSCKTTLGNTAEKVLVLDFDRGVSRSFHRQDTLIMNSWDDVVAEEKANTFKDYKTVVIDTAKAALDDFLMSYVTNRDYKLKTNKLKAYGEIGDEFKLFLNNRRNEGLDVIIIAHAKKDEDTKRSIPDVTGQSYQLILRVADQVGYVSFLNNERSIQWTPTDLTIGKNTANLPSMQVPHKDNPALKTFMAEVIASVKSSIASMSEAQELAVKKMTEYQERLAKIDTPKDMTTLLTEVNGLEPHIKAPMVKLIVARANELGYVANKELKCYELPKKEASAATEAPAAPVAPAAVPEPSKNEASVEIDEETFNFRFKMLTDAGMKPEVDSISIDDLRVTYDDLAGMNEDGFNDLLRKVIQKKAIAKTRKKVSA